MRALCHPRADDLVVVEAHAVGADRARLRACRCRGRAPRGEQPVRRGLVDDRQRVREDVLVPMDRVLLERQRVELGQELGRRAGPHDEPQRDRRHGDHHDAVSSSSRMRSAETISSRGASGRRGARRAASSATSSKRATNRAARSIRSGSSPKEISGSSGVASRRCARSAAPPNGSTSRQRLEVERHRVDREVAAREVDLDVVAERDVRLARVRSVHLGAVRRDLEGPARRPARRSSRTRLPCSQTVVRRRPGRAPGSRRDAHRSCSRGRRRRGPRRPRARRARSRPRGTGDGRLGRTPRPAARPPRAASAGAEEHSARPPGRGYLGPVRNEGHLLTFGHGLVRAGAVPCWRPRAARVRRRLAPRARASPASRRPRAATRREAAAAAVRLLHVDARRATHAGQPMIVALTRTGPAAAPGATVRSPSTRG